MAKQRGRVDEGRVNPFEQLYARTGDLLKTFGQSDSLLRDGDFSVLGYYWGHPQIRVSIHNLVLLRPVVIKSLQRIVSDFPGWEIVVVVAVRGHYDDWPDMGLYVRPHEIIDGLQRQYFAKEFQDLEYEGSRSGTVSD